LYHPSFLLTGVARAREAWTVEEGRQERHKREEARDRQEIGKRWAREESVEYPFGYKIVASIRDTATEDSFVQTRSQHLDALMDQLVKT
jgi:hypothetical protein